VDPAYEVPARPEIHLLAGTREPVVLANEVITESRQRGFV
jgi:hypothetical protein